MADNDFGDFFSQNPKMSKQMGIVSGYNLFGNNLHRLFNVQKGFVDPDKVYWASDVGKNEPKPLERKEIANLTKRYARNSKPLRRVFQETSTNMPQLNEDLDKDMGLARRMGLYNDSQAMEAVTNLPYYKRMKAKYKNNFNVGENIKKKKSHRLKFNHIYDRREIDDVTSDSIHPLTKHDLKQRTKSFMRANGKDLMAYSKFRMNANNTETSAKDIHKSLKKLGVANGQLRKLLKDKNRTNTLADGKHDKLNDILGVASGKTLLANGRKYTAKEGDAIKPDKVYNIGRSRSELSQINSGSMYTRIDDVLHKNMNVDRVREGKPEIWNNREIKSYTDKYFKHFNNIELSKGNKGVNPVNKYPKVRKMFKLGLTVENSSALKATSTSVKNGSLYNIMSSLSTHEESMLRDNTRGGQKFGHRILKATEAGRKNVHHNLYGKFFNKNPMISAQMNVYSGRHIQNAMQKMSHVAEESNMPHLADEMLIKRNLVRPGQVYSSKVMTVNVNELLHNDPKAIKSIKPLSKKELLAKIEPNLTDKPSSKIEKSYDKLAKEIKIGPLDNKKPSSRSNRIKSTVTVNSQSNNQATRKRQVNNSNQANNRRHASQHHKRLVSNVKNKMHQNNKRNVVARRRREHEQTRQSSRSHPSSTFERA